MLLICVSILCWFVDLPISFSKHGTTCISLLPQPSNSTRIRHRGPRFLATSGPFKAPHAPGLEDPTKVTESWVLVTSGMANG